MAVNLVNVFTSITEQEAEETAIDTLLANLGWELGFSEGAGPLWPFVALGFAIYDIFSLFGGGRPEFQDTDGLIAAYNQSLYWPLHSLASDLQIAAKNGAPISDSNPAIQAQFSAWKQGTITSLQALTGQTPGPTGGGYWQLQQLIELSWDWSAGGQSQVTKAVQAIDKMTQGLSQLSGQVSVGVGAGGGTTPPNPFPNDCHSDNSNQDEIGDMCNNLSFQLSLIYDLLTQIGTQVGAQDEGKCCAAVVQAIASVASQLSIIAASISTPSAPPAPVDLSGVVAALQQMVAAMLAFQPTTVALETVLTTGLGNIATAIQSTTVPNVSGIVSALNVISGQGDVDQFIFQALQEQGTLNPADLQTLQGLKWSDALSYIHSLKVVRTIEKFTKDVGADALTVANDIKGGLATVGTWAENTVVGALKTERNVIQDAIGPILTIVESALKPAGVKNIGNIGVDPDTVLSDVIAAGINAYAVSTLIGLKFPGAAEQLNKIIEIGTGLLGIDELKEVQIGPLVKHGIAKIAEMQAKSIFGQELPNATTLAALTARGLITGAQYLTWVPYTGLPGELWTQTLQNAYKPLQYRALATLIQDTPFNTAQMQTVLEDNSLSPANVQFLLGLLQYNSTKNVRNSYINEAQTAYGDGVVGDEELQQILTNAGWSTEAINFATQKALLQRRIKLAAQTESYIVPEVVAGLLTAEEGLNALEAAGVQSWYAQLKITLAQTRAQLNLNKKELAAEAKLANQRNRAAVKTAIVDFRNGNINSVGLEAALLAANQDPLISTLTVATEQAIQQGRLKFVYGQLLTPEAAKVLSDQVAALASQATHSLIDPTNAQAQLQALHVPQPEVTALIARWFASQVKDPVTEQLLPIK